VATSPSVVPARQLLGHPDYAPSRLSNSEIGETNAAAAGDIAATDAALAELNTLLTGWSRDCRRIC